MVEHFFHTEVVGGSIPPIGTYSSLAQLGERLFYIQDVVGSIPTGTTKNAKLGSKTRPNSEVNKKCLVN